MSHFDIETLTTLHNECYYQKRPQPLIDLLLELGVVGRTAEAFWTYYHFGVVSGTFQCQLSSGALAERLHTDIRTIQRANDKLMALGLISRTRCKRRFFSTKAEAPATTRITLPPSLASKLLDSAPRLNQENDSKDKIATDLETGPAKSSVRQSSRPVATEAKRSESEFTTVNKRSLPAKEPQTQSASQKSTNSSTKQSGRTKMFTAVNTPANDKDTPPSTGSPATTLAEAKARLSPELRQAHDLATMKAAPGLFVQAMGRHPSIPESDRDALLAPLKAAAEAKQSGMRESQVKISGGQNPKATPKTANQSYAKPVSEEEDTQRVVPARTLSYIRQRLDALYNAGAVIATEQRLPEILYSITTGTMRHKDLMYGINAILKLIKQQTWTHPRGMPEGWEWQQVIV